MAIVPRSLGICSSVVAGSAPFLLKRGGMRRRLFVLACLWFSVCIGQVCIENMRARIKPRQTKQKQNRRAETCPCIENVTGQSETFKCQNFWCCKTKNVAVYKKNSAGENRSVVAFRFCCVSTASCITCLIFPSLEILRMCW